MQPIESATTDYRLTITHRQYTLEHTLGTQDYPTRNIDILRIHTITSTNRLSLIHSVSPKVLTSLYSSCLPYNTFASRSLGIYTGLHASYFSEAWRVTIVSIIMLFGSLYVFWLVPLFLCLVFCPFSHLRPSCPANMNQLAQGCLLVGCEERPQYYLCRRIC